MFGAYQVGAWKVLSQHFQPDMVVGASIGSLNAWMVACGASPGDLEQHWLQESGMERPSVRFPTRWHHGILDPAYAHHTMRRMCTEGKLQMRIAIVLRRFPNLFRPVVVKDDAITWQHLAASCAIPVVFDLPLIDGIRYADGGLLDPLPLFAARDMGATRILGINCLSWGGFGNVPGALQLRPAKRISFRPSRALQWNRGRVEQWIALGQHDAQKFLDDPEHRRLLT